MSPMSFRSRMFTALTLALLASAMAAAMCGVSRAAIPTNDPDWTWQNPRPSGVAVATMAALGGGEAWLAGDASAALHTADAGASWSAVAAFSVFGATDIIFTDASRGRAVGTDTVSPSTSAAVFYATEDGGATWSSVVVDTGPWAGFDALCFVDSRRGWAAGPVGAVWKTSDSGLTWAPAPDTDTTEDLAAVCFADDRVGFAAGARGALIATTDGGGTWDAQDLPVAADLHDVAVAPDGKHAWAVGDEGVVLHTDDGATWTQQETGATGILTAVVCSGTDLAWTAGQTGQVWRTTDGGETWKMVHSATGSLYSLATTDGVELWAGGFGGLLVRSTDGGSTWKRVSRGSIGDGLTRIDASGRRTACAVGSAGTVLWTDDGGTHWARQPRAVSKDLYDVSVASPRMAVAVGDDGAVIRKGFDGRWRRPHRVTYADLSGVDLLPNGRAWAVGGMGVILHSANGGRTWRRQRSGTRQDLDDVQFVNSHEGWAVGGDGLVLHTTDGGRHWGQTRVLPRHQVNLLAVYFVDRRHGWISAAGMGVGYVILRTTDGGRRWSRAELAQGSFMLDVAFADRRHGWAVGEEGVAYSSDDGGRSWDFHGMLGGVFGLSGVCMPSADRAWAVGSGNAVMRWRRPD